MRLRRARPEPPADIGPALGFLEPAAAEARMLGCNYIGTEHLLLALLARPSGSAGVALRRLGVTPAELRDRLLGKFGTPPKPSVDAEALATGQVPAAIEDAIWFVCSESIVNVTKHAHASHAEVEVYLDGRAVHVEVTDDGLGGVAEDGGSGLRGLRERVEALGGRLTVTGPSGGGTTVHAELPLAGEHGPADRGSAHDHEPVA